MIDDSLQDTAPEYALSAPADSDKALIAELKRRGYKVYPEKRVRIYEAHKMIDRRTLEQLCSTEQLARLVANVERGNAMAVGHNLMDAGALVRSRREDRDYRGETLTAQVCVVLPNTWDFESEMWGIR